MAASSPLSVANVPRLTDAEGDLLAAAARAGGRVVACILREEGPAGIEHSARFLYRRWVLEVAILLRARGSVGFAELARALGSIAGESLAPKLRGLVDAGVAERSASGPRRVAYSLTPPGRAVGDGAIALTAAKAEHARAVQEPGYAPRASGALEPGTLALPGALAEYRRAVGDFAAARLGRDSRTEDAVASARRFSAACVHRWHGEVLLALAGAGPLRFRELREATGAGDQSLANALAALLRLGSVAREGPAWSATDLGRLDLALGAPLVLLVPRSTNPEHLHPV